MESENEYKWFIKLRRNYFVFGVSKVEMDKIQYKPYKLLLGFLLFLIVNGCYQSNAKDKKVTYGKGIITRIAFSTDGELLYTVDSNSEVKIWKIQELSLVKTIKSNIEDIISFAHTQDDKKIVVGGCKSKYYSAKMGGCPGGYAEIWDVDNLKLLGKLEEAPPMNVREGFCHTPTAVDISIDGNEVIMGCNNGIMSIWDANTLKLLSSFKAHVKDIGFVMLSPNKEYLFSFGCDGGSLGHHGEGCQRYQFKIWDFKAKKISKILFEVSGYGSHPVFYNKEIIQLYRTKNLLSVLEPLQTPKVWQIDTNTSKVIHESDINTCTNAKGTIIIPTGRGNYFSIGAGRKLWDLNKCLPTVEIPQGIAINATALSEDEETFAIGGYYSEKPLSYSVLKNTLPAAFGLFKLETSTGLHKEINLNSSTMFSMKFSPDAQYLITGGDKIEMVNAEQIALERTIDLANQYASDFYFLKDSQTLLVRSSYNVFLFDVKMEKVIKDIKVYKHPQNDYVVTVALSPDGNTAALGSCVQWEEELTFNKQEIPTCNTTKITLIDIKLNKTLKELTSPYGGHRFFMQLFFSKDGKYLYASGDNFIRQWDVENGKVSKSIKSVFAGTRKVALSPDERYIGATGFGTPDPGHFDSTSTIIELIPTTSFLESPQLLKGHSSYVFDIAFSPDSKFLFSVDDSRSLSVWDLQKKVKINTLPLSHGKQFLAVAPSGRYLFAAGCYAEAQSRFCEDKYSIEAWSLVDIIRH